MPNDTMSVAVIVPADAQAVITRAPATLADVMAFAPIEDDATAQLVADSMNETRTARLALAEKKAGLLEPVQTLVRRIAALFQPAEEALAKAEQHCKQLLLDWSAKQEERRREAARIQREAEAKARREAEEKAAAERARAQEIAAAEQRKADEARAVQAAAQAEGNTRAAAAAAATAAKAEERAQNVVEAAEQKSGELQLAAAAAAPQVAAPAKVAGFNTAERWVPVLAPGVADELAALRLVVAGAAEDPRLLGFLQLNTTALNGAARSLKSAFSCPGYVAVNQPVARGGRAR